MCTVTFIPSSNGIFITSNRDEKYSRMPAAIPKSFFVNGYELLYPRDGDAGGSWIAVKNNGDAAVLLNGAFASYVAEEKYRQSRGVVFVEMISQKYPDKYFYHADLTGIAPFTVIFYIDQSLRECKWDGIDKHQVALSASRAHIWSSVTLYDADIRRQREDWLQQWFVQAKLVDVDTAFRFHRFAGKGDLENDLVMNRSGAFRTVSITSVHIQDAYARMKYWDIPQNRATEAEVKLLKSPARDTESFIDKTVYNIKRFFIIAGNWEYWPFHLVYAPLYLYWLYLSIKARSLFFFSQANPFIENGGFTNERKSKIYEMIPQQYYPKTVLCGKYLTVKEIMPMLLEANISYPMIAKPDIGERGAGVKLLHSRVDLESYVAASRVDFLVQEFNSYENEIGIFYYRMPGEESGNISGVVGKEFLSVTGDGSSTIEQLIKQNSRYYLQLTALRQEYGSYLSAVLPKGDIQQLVPYGNHARGAKFIDLSHQVSDELTRTIDQFCQKIPGFYYGRLDIKFRSWESLCKGEQFCLIELNGAGSEPTHIYDPSHSLFFAWKEIIRHFRLLYRISTLNAKKSGIPFLGAREGFKLLKDHMANRKLINQCNM